MSYRDFNLLKHWHATATHTASWLNLNHCVHVHDILSWHFYALGMHHSALCLTGASLGLNCWTPAVTLSLCPSHFLSLPFMRDYRDPASGTRMRETPPILPLRSRSTSTSGLPRSQSTSTSGLPRKDDLHQPAVKMTMWRFLNTLFILIVGSSKMISALQGQSVAPDVIDWTIGVIWALMYVEIQSIFLLQFWISDGFLYYPLLILDHRSHWFTVLEIECPSSIPWLFVQTVSLRFASGFIAAPFILFLLAISTCCCESWPEWITWMRYWSHSCATTATSRYILWVKVFSNVLWRGWLQRNSVLRL